MAVVHDIIDMPREEQTELYASNMLEATSLEWHLPSVWDLPVVQDLLQPDLPQWDLPEQDI